jgi:uncharacterized membrane protein YccC
MIGMRPPAWNDVRAAVSDAVLLSLACLVTYLLVTQVLSRIYLVSRPDDLLGGMWAVIATVFVMRDSYDQSLTAAVSRMAATVVSFAYCLLYLAFLPFHTWALPVAIGLSALTARLVGRPGDALTAAITTTVVLVVAAVSPHEAWLQPILRFADTAIGVAVGVAAVWLDLRVIRPARDRARVTRR